MAIFDELDERGLLIVPRLSPNESERLVPVADRGQRAHDFRDGGSTSKRASLPEQERRSPACFGSNLQQFG